jgi:predicted transcriptional regulator YdeE
MDYEIVQLPEKKVAGLKVTTSNTAADMQAQIGELWRKFHENGYNAITNKADVRPVGLYNHYTTNAAGELDGYDAYAGCIVTDFETIPDGLATTVIPAGNYAKFTAKGEMRKIVDEVWGVVWNMPLERTFAADFEEYQNADMRNAEIHFYIAVK